MQKHTDVRVDYRAYALASARRTIPPTMRWTGAIVLTVAIVNEVIPPATANVYFVGLCTYGAIIFALGRWMEQPSCPGWLVPWLYTCMAMTLVFGISLMYTNRPVGWDFVYIGITVAGFAPLTFGWAPFFVASTASLIASTIALYSTNTPNAQDWVVGVIAAIAIGGMLLGQRLQLVYELAEADFAREQLVETDALTGLLNRRGVHSRTETLWAGAIRRDEPVNIAFIDIVGLKRANDAHGHELGDRIIVEVAAAIRASARRDDLVSRWGGDEFVVLAKGDVSSAAALQDRVLTNLNLREAVFGGRWQAAITVGTASAAPAHVGFQELLERADADMYERRRAANPDS